MTTNHPDPTPPPSEPAPSLRPVEEIRAAADRENAELRGDVAEALKAVEYFDAQSKRRRAERDDLRAQLAAAQVQLAEAQEAIDQSAEVMSSLGGALVDAEARLEAVREIRGCLGAGPMDHEQFVDEVDEILAGTSQRLAALSAAPQPEPETKTAAQLLREITERDPAGHKAAIARGYGLGRDPAHYPDPEGAN